MSVKSKPENDEVKAAIAEIERRYEIGHAVLKLCGQSSPTGLIKEAAWNGTCQKRRDRNCRDWKYDQDYTRAMGIMVTKQEPDRQIILIGQRS